MAINVDVPEAAPEPEPITTPEPEPAPDAVPEPVPEPAPEPEPAAPEEPVESRVAKIEAALAARIGLNLSEFDGVDVLAARAAKLEEAAKVAVAAVHEAFTEPELTVHQRVERIEKALHSGGALA